MEALKEYRSNFNEDLFLKLPTETPYGNLNVSWMEIVTRIEYLNDIILTLYAHFYAVRQVSHTTLDRSYREKFLIEHIFYFLRKTADELIQLISILSDFKQRKTFSQKIRLNSIDGFLKSKLSFNGEFEEFKEILGAVNKISNCFKHSFINSQTLSRSGDESPAVYAFTLHYNNLNNEPEFYELDLGRMLVDFNGFLKHSKEYIKLNFEEAL
ncbi:hypothetical protein [Solitalea longa]|nr:hypothetical protein [Solitalea longa]